MKSAFILVLMTLHASLAFAQSGTKMAQEQARSFFVPCAQPDAKAKSYCLAKQKQFAESYELAAFGETFFIGDLEGFLDPRGPTAERTDITGIRPDLIEASAWRYWRWKIAKPGPIHDRYYEAWKRTARELTPEQVEATKQRVEGIKALIMAQRWPMRADLWRVRSKVQGMEEITSQMEDYQR